ncbi:amidohydrolase family protein [Pontixanthobacter sp. CEM42]|uniref:amidohydrolase n=1 Tax=Pontixanthobacter sp. CEM42 TaxID=2792077 RepID=UPI001ADFA085|nr:amidohydrolase family protein [Pontixanthobacter sp. CEM42]
MAGFSAAPLMAASPAALSPQRRGPVTVFEARSIVTMEQALPSARFMAVADGTILGVADSLDELGPWTKDRETKVDRQFAGKVLFPGLVDPHIHPMQAAVMLGMPFVAPDDWKLPGQNWQGVAGQEAYRRRLKKVIDGQSGEPIVIWGHHELFHGPMDRQVLDAIERDRPVIVWQRSFHDVFANSAALRWMDLDTKAKFDAAIAAGKADPEHGDFAKGIFSETALQVAIGKLRPVILAPKKLQSGFAGLQTMMHDRGVTTTADMATGIFAGFEMEAGLIANAFNRPNGKARVSLIPIASELDSYPNFDPEAWYKRTRDKFASDKIIVDKRVKLFVDGAFFAQNMRMGSPGYSDGHVGKWLTEPDVMRDQLARYWDAGFSLHIHVNGDEGAAVLLDTLGKLPHRLAQTVTLEHLGYCTEAQIEQILQLGLMVSAQPNYIRVLGDVYSRTGLGADRASLMNRLGSLERTWTPLGLHSDFNMAPIDPFYLAWIAQTREGIDGVARGEEERLSRWKALRAITIEAAQVIGMNDTIGSLSAGKKADFVALDDDPFEVETDAMKEMPIAATVFEGVV